MLKRILISSTNLISMEEITMIKEFIRSKYCQIILVFCAVLPLILSLIILTKDTSDANCSGFLFISVVALIFSYTRTSIIKYWNILDRLNHKENKHGSDK